MRNAIKARHGWITNTVAWKLLGTLAMNWNMTISAPPPLRHACHPRRAWPHISHCWHDSTGLLSVIFARCSKLSNADRMRRTWRRQLNLMSSRSSIYTIHITYTLLLEKSYIARLQLLHRYIISLYYYHIENSNVAQITFFARSIKDKWWYDYWTHS